MKELISLFLEIDTKVLVSMAVLSAFVGILFLLALGGAAHKNPK